LFARPDAEIAADVEAAVAAALPGERWSAEVRDGVVTLTAAGPRSQPEVARRVAQAVPGVVRVRVADPVPPVDR
jgi:hypothetical protein